MAKTYGVLSDFHEVNIRVVPPTIELLKREEVDALVLNGDLFGERSGYNPQQYLATILDIVGKSGLETYVLPGSHEEVHLFEPVMAHFTQQYSNLVNTLDHPFINQEDHHLVFLPGSDWRAGEATNYGYSLENQNNSGVYNHKGKLIRVVNMSDLTRIVSEPDKTLVFSHVPRKFDDPETGVDMAEFGEVKDTFQQWRVEYSDGSLGMLMTHGLFAEQLQGHFIENKVRRVIESESIFEGSIYPGEVARKILIESPHLPIELKKENRGNDILRALYEQLSITKNITGHFHESAGRANDLEGRTVQEGLYVSSLFYNASCMDQLKVGMVSVSGPKVAYENIDLRKHL